MGPDGDTRVVKVPEEVKKFDSLKEEIRWSLPPRNQFAIEVSSPEK